MIRRAVWLLPVVLFVSDQVSGQELYRYVDENGVTIMNSSIPAEYVNSGYEIIDSMGQVIQVVPAKVENDRPELVVEKADTILMTSFSSAVEIEKRRDRVVEDIEREIANLESDRRVLGLQIAEQVAERDRLLRIKNDRGLSEHLEGQLATLEEEILSMKDISLKLQANLQRRSSDIVAIQNEYALKVERFVQLQQAEIDVRHSSIQEAE